MTLRVCRFKFGENYNQVSTEHRGIQRQEAAVLSINGAVEPDDSLRHAVGQIAKHGSMLTCEHNHAIVSYNRAAINQRRWDDGARRAQQCAFGVERDESIPIAQDCIAVAVQQREAFRGMGAGRVPHQVACATFHGKDADSLWSCLLNNPR